MKILNKYNESFRISGVKNFTRLQFSEFFKNSIYCVFFVITKRIYIHGIKFGKYRTAQQELSLYTID